MNPIKIQSCARAAKLTIWQKCKFITGPSALALCFALGSQTARAQLYDVDFGETGDAVMTGAAILGSSGDLWNAYQAGWYTYSSDSFTETLENNTGSSAAGVTVNVNNYITGYNDFTGGTTPNPNPLMGDYITSANASDGWPIEVTLGNLPVNMAYELVVYSAGDGVGQGAQINITDPTFTTDYQTEYTTGADRNIANGQGDGYQIFTGTIGSSGDLYFDVANTSNWHALNGLQLQLEPVPEPTTLALAGLGGLSMLFLRRRKA